MNEVDVYSGHQSYMPCGRLGRAGSRHVFSYRHDAGEALSLTMPVRRESYRYDGLHPVFQMNLPEGALREALERITAKQYGSDDLTLLSILGTSQIGRMAYSAVGAAPQHFQGDVLSLEQLLGHQKAGLFQDLLQRYARSSGVAGIQPKVLRAFGMSHCQLARARMLQAEDEVEAGIQANLPLLEALAAQHEEFAGIAARMLSILRG